MTDVRHLLHREPHPPDPALDERSLQRVLAVGELLTEPLDRVGGPRRSAARGADATCRRNRPAKQRAFPPRYDRPATLSRRRFVQAVSASLVAAPLVAEAQAAQVYRIGFLGLSSAEDYAENLRAFRQGLRDLGYEEARMSGSSTGGRRGGASVLRFSPPSSLGFSPRWW